MYTVGRTSLLLSVSLNKDSNRVMMDATTNDDEYQRTQFEIEELRRKEEELRKKMAVLANKRRSLSRESLDNDEQDIPEIGKARSGSSSNTSQSKKSSRNISPNRGNRPGSVSPLKEKSNLKRRGSDRSQSTPETNVKDLKDLSFQRRRSSDKNINKSTAKKTDRNSADYSNESLNGDDGKLRRSSKKGQQSPKTSSTGNLSAVEVPENTFRKEKYDKRNSSSHPPGKRGSRSSRDFDSYDIIEITPPANANRGNEVVNETMNNELVNGEYQQNNEEDDRGSDSLKEDNPKAWEKIERELEEQKERELEFQGLKKQGVSEPEETVESQVVRSQVEQNEEMNDNKEIDQNEHTNNPVNVWEKIEMEIEEEKRRDEEMALKNRIIFQEDMESDDSVEEELEEEEEDEDEEVEVEDEDNDSNQMKSMGRIELEIEEQMRKEMEIKMLRSPGKESGISDSEDPEQTATSEGSEEYETVKTRIDKELEEMRERELELKTRLGLEGEYEDGEGDETRNESDSGAKGKITMEIDEFRKRESEFRKLHGVVDDENGDEEIDEGLEEEIINDEVYSDVDENVSENENGDISDNEEDETESLKDKHMGVFSKVEEEIAEQRKKDKEFKLAHNINVSDEDELPEVNKLASGRNEEAPSKPKKLVLPGVFAGAAIKQSKIQNKNSNQNLKPNVLVRDTTNYAEEDNDSESSIEDEGIYESFEEDQDYKSVSSSSKITSSRSDKIEEGKPPRQDQDLDAVTPGLTRKFIQIFDANKNDLNKGSKFRGNLPSKRKDDRELSRKTPAVKEKVVQQEQNMSESIPDTNFFSDGENSINGDNPENGYDENDATPEKGLRDPKPGKKLVLRKKKSKKYNENSSDDDVEVNQYIETPKVANPPVKSKPKLKGGPKQTKERKQDGKRARKTHPLALQFEKMEEENRVDAELTDLKLQRKKLELEKKKQQELEEKRREEVERQKREEEERQQLLREKRREMEEAWKQKKSIKGLEPKAPKPQQNGIDNKTVKKTTNKDTSPCKRRSSTKRSTSPTKTAKSNIKVWEERIQSHINE